MNSPESRSPVETLIADLREIAAGYDGDSWGPWEDVSKLILQAADLLASSERGMTEARACEILEPEVRKEDGSLYSLGWYLSWSPMSFSNHATLDGKFSADDLEAIAWWMRNKVRTGGERPNEEKA